MVKKITVNRKRILVFLLIMVFIAGAMNPMRLTAVAAETEGEAVTGITNSEPGEDTSRPECICETRCSKEEREADCSVCGEDLSACGGKDMPKKPDENETNDTEDSVEFPADAKEAAIDAEDKTKVLPGNSESVMPAAADGQIEEAWNAMTAAMINWDAQIDLSGYNLTADDMERIWPDVAQDNPDLFYVLNYAYFTSPDGIVQKCQFTYNTQYNQDSVLEYRAAIDRVFAEVIGNNMTDEQKALALHDYLVQHMVYDQNANNNLGIEKRNAYEALVNGIGVCQGYTLAYAALLKKAGIEVEYCKSKSMNHIWNYVKLDGKWYHADLTYDDAAAASQVGETGYVRHTYFLLSDGAMRDASHEWEANDITCGDTRYDHSWHKTAPLSESAIYTVDGASYYLKGNTVAGAPTAIYNGASLIKRDSDGTENSMGSFEIENLGNGWPMYQVSFSRISCSKGVLYFNVGNSAYSFDPSKDTAPVKTYQYEDTDKRIVTGLLVSGGTMTLEIYNTGTNKIDEKINIPIPQEPEEETIFKTEIKNGISDVPDSFKDKDHLNTPEKIEQEIKQKLKEKVSGIEETNIAVYDVRLLVNVNGTGWQEAAKDNFPSDGLSVTLPYPSDTGQETYDFAAAHMFTADMNGFYAGDVEYPDVTKTEEGIVFKVYGLSPIAIGWQEVNDDSAGDNDGDNDNSNDSAGDNGSGGSAGDNGNNGNVGDNGSGGSTGDNNNGGSGSNGNNGNGSNNNSGSGNGNNGSGSNSENGNGNNGGNNSNMPTRSVTEAPATGDTSPVMLYVLLTAAFLSIIFKFYRQMRRSC